ncbi:MAG: hypothetical protein AUH34_01555 [Gemmatimonadetes bacterium 13_1_40CM_70_12]|nr:MAG: hypothetical protein AUH34_01555 [Gemmatimonadetes bacterium 13_1_40CM_70_12]
MFGAASPEGAWTVGEVTRQARAVLEGGLGPLWVRGEVSGFKAWQSGHWYFALRDRTAQLRCVMFQKDNRRLPGPPTDGMQVFVFGRPTVWEEKGEFRLTVIELLSTERGGLWQLAFEKAKAALQKDGLLDPARKRPLPLYPARLAIVTSKDGAAVRDIIAVTRRRWPSLELFVIPTKVQGDGAEDAICRALALLGRIDRLDVAIVGRGGGSREDLWSFNSERVARAVAAVPVPVISAVGHETDSTLCDLVPRPRPESQVGARDAAARPHARSPGRRHVAAARAPPPSAVGYQRSARCVVTAQDSGARVLVGPGCRGTRAQADRPVSPRARLPAAGSRRRGRGARHGRRGVTPEQTSFARQLERLEEIVRRLEAEDLDLDDALKLFEEGVERLRQARERLTVAEAKVKQVLSEHAGKLRVEDFDG